MKLGFNATWSMAVGGMVGGGIFSTLGVVIQIAGAWVWLSFLVAGLTALMSGYAYAKLAAHYHEGGGAFTFLREIHAEGFAGSLSWILFYVKYVLGLRSGNFSDRRRVSDTPFWCIGKDYASFIIFQI